MWKINNYIRGKSAEVLIYGEIGEEFGGVNAAAFYDEVSGLDAPDGITFRINSPGGDGFAGWAIYNQIRRLSVPTVTAVDGLAASIASVIAMAGDRVTISENGMLMIHNSWTALSLAGDANALDQGASDIERMTGTLRAIDDSIVATYLTRVSLDEDTLRAYMNAETWFTSSQSLELGFVDDVTENLAIAACLVPEGKYRNTPSVLLAGEAGDETRQNLAQLAAVQTRGPDTPGVEAWHAGTPEEGVWTPDGGTKSAKKMAEVANWFDNKRNPELKKRNRARAWLRLNPPPASVFGE